MKPGPIWIAGLALVVAVAAAWRVFALIDGAPIPDAVALSSVPRGPAPTETAPLSYAAASWSRPLFSTTDGSANSAAAKPKPAGVAPKSQMPRLIGVLTQGTDRVAVIDIDGQIKRVRQDEIAGEWRLVRVDPRTVVVRQRDVSHTLSLDQPASGARSTAVER